MYQVTRTATRPSTDIEFYSILGDDEFKKNIRWHWSTVYQDTGLSILTHQELSDDQLTLITIFVWESEDAYNAATADPVVINFWTARDEYNDTHGITYSEVTSTI